MTTKNNITIGYKDSAVGIIPEEWEVRRLGEICLTFKSGTTITSQKIRKSDLYPVYGGNGLRGYTNFYTHDGDYILIGRQGALCGNINFIKGKAYISEHAIAVQPNKYNSIEFLRHKLDFWNLNRFSESSAQPGLSVEKLVRYKLAVPPLEEQKKIAEILSTWDEAIEKQSKLIEKLELRKRGIMQRLLTGRTRLPGFTTPWQKVSYSEILKEIKRNIIWNDNEEYDLISVKRRSGGLFHRDKLLGKDIKTKNLRPANIGDFLISKMQIVHGASGLVTKEFDGMKISGSYIALVAKDKNKTDINFINWYSKTPHFYHQTYVSSSGVHIEKMTFDLNSFMSMNMKIPSFIEQKAIVNLLNTIDKEINIQIKKLETLRTQKRGLMQQLLTGKTRVKI